MVPAKLLFMGNIDEKVGIAGVEVMEGNSLQRFHGLAQGGVDGRAFESRMAKEDQNLFHCRLRFGCCCGYIDFYKYIRMVLFICKMWMISDMPDHPPEFLGIPKTPYQILSKKYIESYLRFWMRSSYLNLKVSVLWRNNGRNPQMDHIARGLKIKA
jgi:hypothetical protein